MKVFTTIDKAEFVVIAETKEEWEQLKKSRGVESLIARHYFDAQTIHNAKFVTLNCVVTKNLW